jgi:hypothetical protein
MAAVNPFGGAPATPAPAEEAQQQTPPTDPWQPTLPATSPPPVVAVSGEGKIVMTFKEGTGFESTWNVVHADSVADAKAILADPEFKDLLEWQKDAAAFFRGGPVSQGSAPRGGGGQRQAPPTAAKQPPAGAPTDPWNGEGRYSNGITKSGRNKGNVWHAWFPPDHLKEQGVEPLWFDV